MDSLDVELNELINKVSRLQEQVGGAKKTSSIVSEDGRIDKFMELRNQMEIRVATLKETLEHVHSLEKSPGSNPKELIGAQSKVRTELTALNEDWKQLDTYYRNEARKKRSKFSPEEMKLRQQMLVQLQMELQTIKEIQRSGYVKGYQAVQLVSMEESEIFKPKEDPSGKGPKRTGVVGQRQNNLTDDHRAQLQIIKERDQKIDEEIVQIGVGVDQLRELAKAANEEVKLQNKMLETLETKIEDVHDHVANINEKLKETLEQARKSDKICMDIFCVMILVGMIIVLVKLSGN